MNKVNIDKNSSDQDQLCYDSIEFMLEWLKLGIQIKVLHELMPIHDELDQRKKVYYQAEDEEEQSYILVKANYDLGLLASRQKSKHKKDGYEEDVEDKKVVVLAHIEISHEDDRHNQIKELDHLHSRCGFELKWEQVQHDPLGLVRCLVHVDSWHYIPLKNDI